MSLLGTGHIEDAQVLSEESMPLSDGSDDFIKFVARQADRITSGRRGTWVTEALIIADYAKDKDSLRSAYKADKGSINRYFEEVDVQRIINDAGPGVQQQLTTGITERIKNNVPGFIAGSIVAAGSIIAINKFKRK